MQSQVCMHELASHRMPCPRGAPAQGIHITASDPADAHCCCRALHRELDCQDLGEVVALVGGAFPAWGVQDLQRLVRS